ncbi:DUF397 domain-containing protein [Nocardia aurantiaca]|nr:DUF397 domain-containing protein [Nocardia aurantiaca]
MNTIALTWRKSSYSGSNGGECVEVAFDSERVFVRDSKYLRNPANNPAEQPLIAIESASWPAFLGSVLETDIGVTAEGVPAIDRTTGTGAVSMRSADGTCLTYTAAEWSAFTSGVRDGEFFAV